MTTPGRKPRTRRDVLADAVFIVLALIVVGLWVLGWNHTL